MNRNATRAGIRILYGFGLVVSLIAGTVITTVPCGISFADEDQQGAGNLVFGEKAAGVISDDGFRALYAFDGRENDVIAITMTRVSGDLDPYLILTDEYGEIVALSDDDGVSINAQIPFKRLISNGRYFVIATRFGQEHGSTTGEFSLQLERVGAETTENTVLKYGDSVFGRVTSTEPVTFYFLRAERGDVINVSMRRTSGDLDPQLEFATSEGIVLATNDDDPYAEGTLDAGIRTYTVLKSGTHLIVATRFGREAGDTQGSYVLSVERIPPEDLGTSIVDARLIDYGMTLEATIDEEIIARYFYFQAKRGDVITITQSKITGNLDALLKLTDKDLNELAQDDDRSTTRDARIAAFTIPASGTYYIIATRSGEQDGRTTGDFSLELNGRAGVAGDEALEIIYGATVSGQINNENSSEEYIFFGERGDTVRITMSRASGDLDSLITVYDSNRKQIVFDDDSGDDKDALIQSFVLPADDTYILIASRFERGQGTTSGAYILALELIRSGN